MEWLIIVLLVLIGAILVVMEFLIFPGVNVAGVLGFICIIAGIYFGYHYYGAVTGHLVLMGTVLFGGGITWYALRSNTWKRLSLDTKIDAVVEGVNESIKEGDEGICLGRLAPMGKVQLGDDVVEAESQSGYIEENSRVEVVKVYRNKVVVKKL